MNKPNIAIAGATGVVGQEMIAVLSERKFPVGEVRLLASEESAGEIYKVLDQEVVVEELTETSFEGIDIALFATSSALSKEFVPMAEKSGAVSIDNSSHFRMVEGIPLVVPEVNAHVLTKEHKIIANPNCSTIQLVPVLDVLRKEAALKRVIVSTYQSVSGAGKAALEELWNQTRSIFTQSDIETNAFQHQIAFNCIPQIDLFSEDGYTLEERKLMGESRKILDAPSLAVSATAVRVPVFHSHAESVNVEFESDLTPERAKELLENAAGISVCHADSDYPMQLTSAGKDEISVGRIRKDPSIPFGLNLWIVADNIRKGAALNAVQIAEHLLSLHSQ